MTEYSKGQLATMRAMRPTRRTQCLYLCRVSQLIRSTTGEERYTDTYFQCNCQTVRRITRKQCRTCVMYKPIISDNGEY